MNNFLLPEGFRDTLPNLAAKEVSIFSIFCDLMLKTGYQIVKPSLIEFEKSLFFLNIDRENVNSFRLLDPLSAVCMINFTGVPGSPPHRMLVATPGAR